MIYIVEWMPDTAVLFAERAVWRSISARIGARRAALLRLVGEGPDTEWVRITVPSGLAEVYLAAVGY